MLASELFTLVTATILVTIVSIIFYRVQTAKNPIFVNKFPEPTALSKKLAAALPAENVIFPQEIPTTFNQTKAYWSKQARETIPACIVRPRDTQQLSTAITILKHEHDNNAESSDKGLFAVCSGGHSPVPGAASIDGGVVIDLSFFSEVTLSEDRESVVLGSGARWGEVARVLEGEGVAVVGGRDSDVGVGGLSLGGGLSFFTPRFGLVCSNIISYEVVLASGSIVTASETSHPDLWRALKGGSNNFGIVTRFTARAFPSSKIWGGWLYMPAFQAIKVLAAFHDHVNNGASDTYAAGPMACFSCLSTLGMQIISVNLVHTKTPEKGKKWPSCWENSGFRPIGRFWSSCKVRTLSDAYEEMTSLSPPGRRQIMATTTIKNDPDTLAAVHAAFRDGAASLRKTKNAWWHLILQPTLAEWIQKGDATPLGLDHYAGGPLINVEFAVAWPDHRDDQFVHATTRKAIEQIDTFAAAKGTDHPYRYLNYCAYWQKPFEGYGEENLRFLQETSRRYDPDGMFQRGCVGGFKLDIKEE